MRLELLTRQQLPALPALRAPAGDHMLSWHVLRLDAVARDGNSGGYNAILGIQPRWGEQ
jgi:hypothetical protein